MTATWRKLLINVLDGNNETLNDIESSTLTEVELDIDFDDGYGCSEGKPFTVWTKNYVYFPVVYDGAEWVGFTYRNPNGKSTSHQGGE